MLDEGGHVLLALTVASLARWLTSMWSSRVRRGQFVRVGKVSELNLYPVKSCPGIPLQSARAESAGLVSEGLHDRCFTCSFVLFFFSVKLFFKTADISCMHINNSYFSRTKQHLVILSLSGVDKMYNVFIYTLCCVV